MNLLEQTKYLIKQTGLHPDKIKGQNFCVDESVLVDMVNEADIKKTDVVLEVGAGFGFLTQFLVKTAGNVIAVEIEPMLVNVLRNLEKVNYNLQVVEGDIFKIVNSKFGGNYKIAANIPYSITSAFLKKFLTASVLPQSITLLLQKEAAKRVCAPPGQMSLLSLSVQLYATPKIIRIVKPASFWPSPKVDSAILKIENISAFPFAGQVGEKFFWQVLKSGFCSRRKTLENNLANCLHLNKSEVSRILAEIGFKKAVRAQELAVHDWLKIALLLKK